MSDDRWEFEEGQEIWPGRRALSLLGRSNRYETWLALEERFLSVVVVKILRPHRVEEEHVRRDMEQEAETLFRLGHPIVLRAFDAVLDGPRPHLVLEHLEGPTLRQLMRRYGALEMEQFLPLALNICSALHYLSLEDVVHLDVKPENIVMCAPPRLIDFSIARRTKDARELRSAIGTYAYMAPEQAIPNPTVEIGAPADVWGLGVTMYEAIVGRMPFDPLPDEPDPAALPQLSLDPAYISAKIPAPLIESLWSCLERDPAARPTAAELALQLEPLVSQLPTYPVLRRSRRIR